jgi:CRP-like cAMP-binding protein
VGRHLSNQLLARLDKATFAAIEPELSIVRLELGHVISETHSEVHTVYFPLNGVISCVVELIGGGAIETGMIGKDGQFGAAAALDHHVSLNHVVMQVSGEVLAIEASRFRYLIEQHPSLRKTTVAYDQFFWRKSSRRPHATQSIRSRRVHANGFCGCRGWPVTTCL